MTFKICYKVVHNNLFSVCLITKTFAAMTPFQFLILFIFFIFSPLISLFSPDESLKGIFFLKDLYLFFFLKEPTFGFDNSFCGTHSFNFILNFNILFLLLSLYLFCHSFGFLNWMIMSLIFNLFNSNISSYRYTFSFQYDFRYSPRIFIRNNLLSLIFMFSNFYYNSFFDPWMFGYFKFPSIQTFNR